MARQITWYPPTHTGLGPIVLNDEGAGYRLHTGTRGLGEVQYEHIIDTSPWADGTTVDATYVLPRSIMLPITLHGADRDELLARLAALTAAMPARVPGGGPALGELELAQHDGRRYRTKCYYEGGLPSEETVETGGSTNWVRFQLRLFAADPFWYDAEPVRLRWTAPESVPFLGPNFLPVKISPSNVLGPGEIVNPGSETALGTWRVTPPGSDFIATNEDSGETLRVTQSIPTAYVLTIKTEPGAQDVYIDPDDPDDPNIDWWQYLVDGSALWEIPPGTTAIDLTLAGSTSGSVIELEFYPRRRAPW